MSEKNTIDEACSSHDRRIALLEQLSEGIDEKLDKILEEVTKVAVLEERHNSATADIDRAHEKVRIMEVKHDALAIETREFTNQTKGMIRIVWAIAGVVGMLLVKVLFFAASHGVTP